MDSLGRSNNFDLIRLFAALQVVFVHGSVHLKLTAENPTISQLMAIVAWFPGVPIFFVISGYLIATSFARNDLRTLPYTVNRILRIYPALYVCLGISIIVLFAFEIVTLFSFASAGLAAWLLAQLTLFQFYNPPQFRSFGVGVLNGSLWTIPVEVTFYIIIPFLMCGFKAIKLKSINFYLLSIGICSYVVFLVSKNAPTAVAKYLIVTIAPHLWMFLLGVAMYYNQSKLMGVLKGRVFFWFVPYVLFNIFITTEVTSVSGAFCFLLKQVLLAGVVLSAAFSMTGLSNLVLRGNDVSYGVYIYHMIVTNSLVQLGLTGSLSYLLLLFIATLFVGFLSWRFVEAPVLRRKREVTAVLERIVRTRAPRFGLVNETSFTKS
jgi:peptidoglycan/LPS O-acetylase OafA/YrhL